MRSCASRVNYGKEWLSESDPLYWYIVVCDSNSSTHTFTALLATHDHAAVVFGCMLARRAHTHTKGCGDNVAATRKLVSAQSQSLSICKCVDLNFTVWLYRPFGQTWGWRDHVKGTSSTQLEKHHQALSE
eukprot:6487184-Amphidinium_carterae.1